jgi:hypothetical protein
MFIPAKRLTVVMTVTLAAFLNLHAAKTQTVTLKNQADLTHRHRLADLGIDAASLGQFPVGGCSQEKPEPPTKCNCTDALGHITPRQAACYSCWDPSTGQQCGGPYCQSCADVCVAGGGVPIRTPNACH